MTPKLQIFRHTPHHTPPRLPARIRIRTRTRMATTLRSLLALARADKPTGTLLLFVPGAVSIALAAAPGTTPDAPLMSLFAVGSVLLRGAGCTINDMCDRDVDKLVARTRHRPLASGALSMRAATAFLGAQLALGAGVLYQLPPDAHVVGAASLPLVALYPLAKRVTDWPQLMLGATINWGAIFGYAATSERIERASANLTPRLDSPLDSPLLRPSEWPACFEKHVDAAVVVPLYVAFAAWTLLYDTIYAYQDMRDDARIGVRSSARALGTGARARAALLACACVAAAGTFVAGRNAGVQPLGWYDVGVATGATGLAMQAVTARLTCPASCAFHFNASPLYGFVLLAAASAERATDVRPRRAAKSEPVNY